MQEFNTLISGQQTSDKWDEKNTVSIITLSSWLTCLISILSLTMLLFIFLYYEIYFLMNILSILVVY
jgi:hypothetical protein